MTKMLPTPREHMDLTDDLAKNLPRSLGWIPVVGKRVYRWWVGRRRRMSAEFNVAVRLEAARIDIGATDEGSMDLRLSVTNFGRKVVEVDRMELHSLSIGARSLFKQSDMIKMTGGVFARTVQEMHVCIELKGADVRHTVQGIGKAMNLLSTPQAMVSVYADVLVFSGKERFRKTIHHSVPSGECHIVEAAIGVKAGAAE